MTKYYNEPDQKNNVYEFTTKEKTETMNEFEMDKFLDGFNSGLFALMLKQETTNKIFKVCIDLVAVFKSLN